MSAAILTYAARYALGRRTSAPHDVEDAIAANIDLFKRDHGCRQSLISDIERYARNDALGDDVDRQSWMRTLGRLRASAVLAVPEEER